MSADELRGAIDAITTALTEGADRTALRRSIVPVAAGELLLMPAESRRAVGTKVISVAHHNADVGLPRIQGTYLLMDAATLTPVWHSDAAALTVLRTTAVSMASIETVLARTHRRRVGRAVVWGTGPQAERHVTALAELGLADSCAVVGRSATAVSRVVETCRAGCADMAVSPGSVDDLDGADLVLCCTAATTPLFDDSSSGRIADSAIVVAIGSHRPDERELPTALLDRARIVVDGASAIDTAGDILVAESELGRRLTTMLLGDLVRRESELLTGGPVVCKTVGEAWQDLAVAESLAGDALGPRR